MKSGSLFLYSQIIAEMPSWEGKQYNLNTSENFDGYLKELGVGFILRKLANAASVTQYLVRNGDTYRLTTRSAVKTEFIDFKSGIGFDEVTFDGRKCKSVVTIDGDKLVHVQKSDKTAVLEYEFTPDSLTVTLTAGDVKSVRGYTVA